LILPVEKAQSIPQRTLPESIIPKSVDQRVPIINHITTQPIKTPITIPGHHAFEGSKKTAPRKKPPHINQNKRLQKTPSIFIGGSGRSTISPVINGHITSSAADTP